MSFSTISYKASETADTRNIRVAGVVTLGDFLSNQGAADTNKVDIYVDDEQCDDMDMVLANGVTVEVRQKHYASGIAE